MTRTSKLRICFLLFIAAVVPLTIYLQRESAPELYEQAKKQFKAGRFEEAERLCRKVVQLEPDDSEALLIAAECAIQRDDDIQAVEDLSRISRKDPTAWRTAQFKIAELFHHNLHSFHNAEIVYKDLLGVNPDHLAANEGFARLLGLCGRRSEAIPYILKVIQAGERTDLLILLSRESASISDPELLTEAHSQYPSDPNPLIGLAQAAAATQQPEVALKHLLVAKDLAGLPDSFHGMLGQELLANQRYDELEDWSREFNTQPRSAESWLVLAALAEEMGDSEGAIRCYWESLKMHPESLTALTRIGQKLVQANQSQLAEPFLLRVEQFNRLREQQQIAIMSNADPTLHQLVEMIKAYETVGRHWEAYGWANVAYQIDPESEELLSFLRGFSPKIKGFPLEQTDPVLNPAMQVDFSHYAIPRIDGLNTQRAVSSTSKEISFLKQASEIGLDFQYFNGSAETTYKMYGFAGGGIAALDFDNDGFPDLFFTQGRPWDKVTDSDQSYTDRLFQNLNGKRFEDVTKSIQGVFIPSSGSVENGFGQGVATGDINNDGFTDLYVANTGTNSLWINNGDGTFSEESFQRNDVSSEWTTSCLIADINGDSYPDIYDVNYLAGEGLFDRLCRGDDGGAKMCLPYDFDAAEDQVWLGDGQGGLQLGTNEILDVAPTGKGLGIAAFRPADSGLSLFIANDTTANFFYVPVPDNASSLQEKALEVGLAFNGEGKAEACMGIAVEDCNQDGNLDLFITNFLYESNTFYSQKENFVFEDQTRTSGLHEVSLPVLGFGTQLLDANLDGNLELFVSNGYIQDLTSEGIPYQMLPQLYEWTGQQFEQLPAQQLGEWANEPRVGRAAARVDWNRDQRMDLVVGVLEDSSYLLTNQSDIDDHQALTLSFVATQSARDAIGTIVRVTRGEKNITYQLTAGDGYQCSNQRIIQIGCGVDNRIDLLELQWPSGAIQKFQNILTGQNLRLIEGIETTYSVNQ